MRGAGAIRIFPVRNGLPLDVESVGAVGDADGGEAFGNGSCDRGENRLGLSLGAGDSPPVTGESGGGIPRDSESSRASAEGASLATNEGCSEGGIQPSARSRGRAVTRGVSPASAGISVGGGSGSPADEPEVGSPDSIREDDPAPGLASFPFVCWPQPNGDPMRPTRMAPSTTRLSKSWFQRCDMAAVSLPREARERNRPKVPRRLFPKESG